MKPIKPPIEDVLDLHTFHPKDIQDLLEDYFAECIKAGFLSVRVVHGKGTGTLKQKVIGCLKKSRRVSSFCDAPSEAGGWGATLVTLKSVPMPTSVESHSNQS